MPSVLNPSKLGLRDFHTMSENETWVALLLFFHPQVWDVHEQRVLFPQPTPHFLQGHPKAAGMTFPPFKGTLSVAESLGMLSKHPKCKVKLKSGELAYSPFPYLGDLLVFLEDQEGAYIVNLSVKDKYEAFRKKAPTTRRPNSNVDNVGVVNRHALEKAYYADAGIPTRQIVGGSIDLELRANLNDLFLSESITSNFSEDQKEDIWEYFQRYVGTNQQANQLVFSLAEKTHVPATDLLTVLKQGIWLGRIRVDMFKPILMDRPLRRAHLDPIAVYANWFRRD